jgi:starch synthase
VPVVRATGGLNDTIAPFDIKTKKGNGIKFRPYESEALLGSIRQAIALFRDPVAWERLIANGMKEDFSWEHSARSYLELYRSIAKG